MWFPVVSHSIDHTCFSPQIVVTIYVHRTIHHTSSFFYAVWFDHAQRGFFFKVNSHFNSSYILTEHCKISVLRKKVMYFNKSLFNHNWNPDWKFNWPIYLFTYLTSFLLNIFASFDSYATIFFTGIPLFLKKDHNLITFYIRPKASENLFNNS